MAREASSVLAPERAATLAIPFIALTATGNLTPAFVNLPILLVMSLRL